MNDKSVITVIKQLYKKMMEPYYQGVAAELSFFFLMSMVPLSLLLAEILGLFSVSTNVLGDFAKQYITEELLESLAKFLQHDPSGTINLVFFLIALWSASKAQYSMIRIANYTFAGNEGGNGFFRDRLRSIGTVVITILLVVFSLVILVYGKQIIYVASLYVEVVLRLPFHFNELWYLIRWPFGVVFFFLMVSLIFYLLPSKRIPYKKIIPGSIVTSAGMLSATWIYAFYASRFANYDVLYGSLGTIVGLMVWFYMLGYIFVLGIALNAILYDWESNEQK